MGASKLLMEKVILSQQTEGLWKNQMIALGGNYLIWSNTPENPYHN